MKSFYDIVFVTNLPAFYKINLYNQIAKKKKILAIFLGNVDSQRNADFYSGDKKFDYFILEGNTLIKKVVNCTSILKSIRFNEIVIGGWDSIIHWLIAFSYPLHKNALVVESSRSESVISGYKRLLKVIFLKRISKVYVPGKANRELLELLNFQRKIIETEGVGIFNIISQPLYREKGDIRNFLYVGRLSPEKNLELLITAFNNLPNLTLNIVGFGPSETLLKSIAKENIIFHGPIDNKDLPLVYQSNDVFILPSLSEPWGLVVEEAFNSGLPVIVSDKVGCCDSIVKNEENGLIFLLNEVDSLQKAILRMTDVCFYNALSKNVSNMDFAAIAIRQINCYD